MNKISQAVKFLHDGGIIAYPTEGVFGFGCDPFNEKAVRRLLKIKNRSIDCGLILIVADWQQAIQLVTIDLFKNELLQKNEGQPITWVFPATNKVPQWIRGEFDSVAIRKTTHPIARELCQKLEGPLVSTSANMSGETPKKEVVEGGEEFLSTIDIVMSGAVGELGGPTEIRDIITGRVIRKQKEGVE